MATLFTTIRFSPFRLVKLLRLMDLFTPKAKFTVVPFAAALVIKTLKELERDRKKTKNIKHNDNIGLDDIIEITKVMRPRSMVKDLKGTANEILGTCVLVGHIVVGKNLKDLLQKINDGDFNVPLE
ncbi:hypothetical protein GOBAR_DD35083 [Gossypium barbadense]|nr:hypothetical protein GOBAR_DD35083 [Gossypium barbadense]